MSYDGFIIKPVADERDIKEALVKTTGYTQWRAHRLTCFAVDLDTDAQLPQVCVELGTHHPGAGEPTVCIFTDNELFHVHKVLTKLADRRVTYHRDDACLDYFTIPVNKLLKLSDYCTKVLLDIFPGKTLKEISDHAFTLAATEPVRMTDEANRTLMVLGLLDSPISSVTTHHLVSLIDLSETLRDGLSKVTDTNYVFYKGSW